MASTFCVPSAKKGLSTTGCWITSESSTYRVQSFLGQGAFGKVVKCTRMTDMMTVAIKFMKRATYKEQTDAELAALSRVKSLDPDKCNIVRWYSSFPASGYVCLEFELLEKSLQDFMRERDFQPLPLKEIRPIVQQVANALSHLRSIRLIHADLKLENIMFVNHGREPYRVKVIDFGLADHVSAARLCSYIQTRPYRSPEIILRLPFTEAVDMWSLGCISAALYLGTLLYTGENEYDMMRCIVETQGNPPEDLLNLGKNTRCFFRKYRQSNTSVWKLKTPDKFYKGTWVESRDTRKWRFTSLDDLLRIQVISHPNAADKAAEMTDQMVFVEMLKGMLHLDASKRIKPHEVLMHRFISMSHMLSLRPQSSYVNACIHIMDLCQKSNSAAESQKAMCRSLQQPTIKPPSLQPPTVKPPSTNPVQGIPPHQGSKSKETRSHPINPDPRSTAQTTCHVQKSPFNMTNHHNAAHQPCKGHSSVKKTTCDVDKRACKKSKHQNTLSNQPFKRSSTVKRKMAKDEESENKKSRSSINEGSDDASKRLSKTSGGPSTFTSNLSSQTQSYVIAKVKRKMAREENPDSDMLHKERKKKRKNSEDGSTSSSGGESSNPLNVNHRFTWTTVHVPDPSHQDNLKIKFHKVPLSTSTRDTQPAPGTPKELSLSCAPSNSPMSTSLPQQRSKAHSKQSVISGPMPKWVKNIRVLLKERNRRTGI